MANRAMAAKVERAKRQARDAARQEFSKPLWNRAETLAGSNARRDALDVMVASFKRDVVHGSRGTKVEPIGKTRRQFNSATYGNGQRRVVNPLADLCAGQPRSWIVTK